MLLVLQPLTGVLGTIGVSIRSMPVCSSVFELAFKDAAVDVDKPTLAVLSPTPPMPLIYPSILKNLHPLPLFLIPKPLALILRVVRQDLHISPLYFVLNIFFIFKFIR